MRKKCSSDREKLLKFETEGGEFIQTVKDLKTRTVIIQTGKKYSADREKLLKFETECREFAKILRSLGQFI